MENNIRYIEMSFLNNFTKYEIPLLGWVRLPEVVIEEKYKTSLGLSKNCSNYEFLVGLIKSGLDKKLHTLKKEELPKYWEAIEVELDLINELGFIDYYLLVWLVINKARELGAFIDHGRGSCAASIIFWLIGVTGIDPVEKKLILSRFISKVRAKKQVIDGITYIWGELAPDVDLNVGGVRKEVVDWLSEQYSGKMAKIAAIGTFTGKILVKDVFKTIEEVEESDAKHVADLIDKHFGIVEDIKKMPEKSPEFKVWSERYPKAFETSLKLRDLIRQKSSHASGYLISFNTLNGFIPLELNKDKELTIAYEMKDAANLSIKLDLLGLVSNQIIRDTLLQIPDPLVGVSLDNESLIYDQFQGGKLLKYGLYQISADCMYRVVSKIKPKNIYELSDCNAISRPGALDYLDGYVKNENTCPHPLFEKILGWTRYYCLYQEQMMQMLMAVGFTADEAEICRKIVGKKEVEKVKEWEQKIYNKIKESNLPENLGPILWKILNDSSKYSFNLSHSLSVSYTGSYTTLLKYKYPLQFYLACLKAAKTLPSPIEEITSIQSELPHFGIKLLPPCILKSDIDFKIDGPDIRTGLSSIKGISDETINKLNNFRSSYSTKFEIMKGAEDAELNITVLGNLILTGALDAVRTKTSRAKLLFEAQIYRKLNEKEKKHVHLLGEKFNYELITILKHIRDNVKDEKGKEIIKPSRFETIKKHSAPFQKQFDEMRKNELLTSWYYEKECLGFSYSTSLYEIFRKHIPDLSKIDELKDLQDKTDVIIVGEILHEKLGKSKKGTPMWKCLVSEAGANVMCFAFNTEFNESISDVLDNNKGKTPQEGDVVIVRGKKKGDSIFISAISTHEFSFKTKKSKKDAENKEKEDKIENKT